MICTFNVVPVLPNYPTMMDCQLVGHVLACISRVALNGFTVCNIYVMCHLHSNYMCRYSVPYFSIDNS